MPKISELNDTILPNRAHELAAEKDGLSVRLTVAQVLGLLSLGDMPDEFADAEALRTYIEMGTPADIRDLAELTYADLPWLSMPIGFPFPLMTNKTGVNAPAKDSSLYRFILLTAGQSGLGNYNEGVLTSESVSGSAPLVVATAAISLAGSPMNGQTVNLINTERRFLRAGSAGTVETAQVGYHRHGLSNSGGGNVQSGPALGYGFQNQGYSATAYTDYLGTSTDENRVKNLGVSYYMRIK